MKRLMTAALAATLVAGAFAQGTFTIRRPADGSRVRETVLVRIPKNSIPQGGYLGILVNGKFLEAVVPDVSGDDYIYRLDTKKRGIPDGDMTIEAVLYIYREGGPMVLNRSSVKVVLDNSASLQQKGQFNLHYKFFPGREFIYNMSVTSSIALVSQAQAQLGSRAAEIILDEEKIRYLVAHENSYRTSSGTQGLIRIQPLPTKGKDYAMLTAAGDTQPKKYMDYEMAPMFMRITDRGREVFTSKPTYFPMEGTTGDYSRFDLFGLFPPPILPSRTVEVGDTWQAAIPVAELDLDKLYETDDFVRNLPGRATFESVEWEQGIPCAKIRSELSLGARDLKGMNNLQGIEGEAQNVKLELVQWFALDRGILIREERRETLEVLVEVAPGGGTASGSGGGGTGPTTRGPAGAGGGGPRSPVSDNHIRFIGHILGDLINPFNQSELIKQLRGGPRGTAGAGGDGGQTAGPAGEGFGAGDGRGTGGAQANVKMIFRQTSTSITTLEK